MRAQQMRDLHALRHEPGQGSTENTYLLVVYEI